MSLEAFELSGAILRSRRVTDRPFRPSRLAPGITQQEFHAGKRGHVVVSVVLGRMPEHEDQTAVGLVAMMGELGWTPKPGNPILALAAEELER